jgi:xylose dehydrogenase (NAD/NADP)
VASAPPSSDAMTLRWGLLSTARINDAFIAGVAGSDRGEVLAVASRDGATARTYADARGIPRAHASYDGLLADPDVDAVYISLPNGLHLPWTEAALRAGKHVLCEKPIGRDPDAVARAFDLAGGQGLVLAEAFMFRHHMQTQRLLELVESGAIGPLRAIRSHFTFVLGDLSDIRLTSELEGGALMDLGCYCVNASRMLAGEPEAVTGAQVSGEGGVDVGFAGAMRFPGGVVAHFDASFQAAASAGLEVVGETGTLRLLDPWHIRDPGIELRDGQGVRSIAVDAANSYALEAEDLAAAVAGERLPRLGRDDAVGQARTLQALYAAAAAAG